MTTTYAFTGHRPKDLPPGFAQYAMYKQLDVFLQKTRDIEFVVGGALGIDSWAANYAIDNGIFYHLMLPFEPNVMSKFWDDHARGRLAEHVLAARTLTIIHHGPYDVRAYQQRNEAMVNAADEVIAFWSGKKIGGTANCIRYALTTGKPIINLLPSPRQGIVKEM